MKTLKLERPVEMLLALLRAALHEREVETAHFTHSTRADWLQCYRLAVRQGVASLAWEAIERMPQDCCPPLDVKLSWAMFEEQQQEKYRTHCRVADELTRLYAQHGIAVVVLKGIGLSRLYPTPAHREGGDIDIYTYSADKSRMTDEEANSLANELIEREGVEVDHSYGKVHSSFFYRGVRFENHSRFLNIDTFTQLTKIDEWLKKELQPQRVKLPDGAGEINVPSYAFDKVFVSLHAAKHYGTGLSLRHLCDWTVLTRQQGYDYPEEPDNRYYHRATLALSQLCNRYLGASIPVEGYGKLPEEMMAEIIYPPFNRKTPFKNPIKAGWYKIRLKLHLLGLRHRLLGVSIWKGTTELFKSILQKPSRLYK